MSAKTEYSPLNLPKPLIGELKIWKMAFGNYFGRNVSYNEMIRIMLGRIRESDPDVYSEVCRIVSNHRMNSAQIDTSFVDPRITDEV